MTTVREIEHAIKHLSPQDYLELSRWMDDQDLERATLSASARIAVLLDEEEAGKPTKK